MKKVLVNLIYERMIPLRNALSSIVSVCDQFRQFLHKINDQL